LLFIFTYYLIRHFSSKFLFSNKKIIQNLEANRNYCLKGILKGLNEKVALILDNEFLV